MISIRKGLAQRENKPPLASSEIIIKVNLWDFLVLSSKSSHELQYVFVSELQNFKCV